MDDGGLAADRIRTDSPTPCRPLVHIGYHKTGTTWLQNHYFPRRDAGFDVPFDRKGDLDEILVQPYPLWFDVEAARRALRPYVDRILAEGRIPVVTSEALCGGDTSGGYRSKELADRVRAVFPDARVLIVVREQKSMLVSSYAMYLRGNGLLSMRDYLLLPRPAYAIPFFNLEFYKYDRLIAYYRGLFGADRVLVLPYELLSADPAAFVAEIAEFSGARAIDGLDFGDRPKSMWPAFSLVMRRFMSPFFDRTVQNGYSWLCPDVRLRYVANLLMWRVVNPLVPRALSRPIERRWRRIVAETTRGYYAESNARTSRLIGRDLAAFGYETAEKAPGALASTASEATSAR